MKTTAGKEKRKHPRFPVGITLDLRANGHSMAKCRGSIVDLSVGGMAFKTDTVLEEGMHLYLKINVPLEVRGEIRHIKGAATGGLRRYGVRFHKIGYQAPEAAKPQALIAAQFRRQP
jgi:c-di-GMP-binding flagellar brake protein YcgR